MNDSGQAAAVNAGQDQPLRELAQRMREVLSRTDLTSENHRKAALRRLLHEQAAGFTRDEIEALVAGLRDRFPDRIFESDRSARSLAGRTEDLEQEVAQLREERNGLRERVVHLDKLLVKLARAAERPVGNTSETTAGASSRRTLVPAAQAALVDVAALLFTFAINQEETARSVEDTIGGGSSGTASRALADGFPELTNGMELTSEDLETIRKRLRSLQLMPGALLTGVQQSWKGGTQEILEKLDPKSAKTSILKYHLVLREVESRFEEFWSNLDRNIDHFYRGRFERVYRDKMEDGP